MDHQHLPHRLTLRKTQRQTTKIILHLIIVIPPGILIVENRRIVPLSAACNRIQGKMLTTSRNSKRELPVSQPFLSRKIQLPASAAVSLTDGHGTFILMRHACTLFHSQILIRQDDQFQYYADNEAEASPHRTHESDSPGRSHIKYVP